MTDKNAGALAASPDAYTDLTGLFAPRSVALVGATDHPSNFGGRVFRAMLNFGYPGKIFPVNPRLKEIYGLTCYSSIKDLPETPDHVGIIVSVERVFDVLADCAARGVPFATVYTAGFAETGTPEGRERHARLLAFARASGMRIMGPNCNGVINFVDAFAMTSTGAIGGPRRAPGNVGVVSHSGGLGQITVMWRAQMAGLGVSYEASCGNEADLDTLDFARFMLRSEATDVVLMAVEGFKDGAKLASVAREALEREKAIVVLKRGRTEAGRRRPQEMQNGYRHSTAECPEDQEQQVRIVARRRRGQRSGATRSEHQDRQREGVRHLRQGGHRKEHDFFESVGRVLEDRQARAADRL
jgi:acetyltransferase